MACDDAGVDTSSRRNRIRFALGCGVLLSATSLLAVLGVGPFAGGASPPPAARVTDADTLRLDIVDPDGRPLPAAICYVMRRPGSAPVGERWDPEAAALFLPLGGSPHSVLVTAPGRALRRVDGLTSDRSVALEPGLGVRFALNGAPAALEHPQVRFLLRIRPTAELVEEVGGLDAADLVDLMTHRGAANSGPRGLPRGEFGYAVSRTQAEAGIVVPAPGRYHVHWGLMDLSVGTWFSLGDACGRTVLVQTGREHYRLDVTDGDLQKTLVGLRSSVQRLSAD
jgi:hypothetical protein